MVVPMPHAAVEHVGDRLEAPMRMRREASDVVARMVGTELIEQQEGIQVQQCRLADDARELHARPIGGRYAANLLHHFPIKHLRHCSVHLEFLLRLRQAAFAAGMAASAAVNDFWR